MKRNAVGIKAVWLWEVDKHAAMLMKSMETQLFYETRTLSGDRAAKLRQCVSVEIGCSSDL